MKGREMTVSDFGIYVFLIWIICGCISYEFITFEELKFRNDIKVDFYDIKIASGILIGGCICLALIIAFEISEKIEKRRKLEEIREKTPWYLLKKFGGYV